MKTFLAVAGALALIAMPSVASAAVTVVATAAQLSAAGTITQTTNFDSFDSSTFTAVANPYTVGGLTFNSGSNIIVGTGTSYHPIQNVIAYNQWSPMNVGISSTAQYNLLGFDLGMLGSVSAVTATITTNLGTYSFSLSAPLASAGLAFEGFQASTGEYFTNITLSSAQGSGSAPATTNYKLGTASAVPEPASWLMMIVGFGTIGAMLRRSRKPVFA